MTDLDIFNPTKVRGLFEALTAERDALAAELAAAKRQDELHWRTRKTHLDHIARLEAALPHLLDFRLSPTFDAKGTYTQAKADEWAKRLAEFSAALAAIDALAPPAPVAAPVDERWICHCCSTPNGDWKAPCTKCSATRLRTTEEIYSRNEAAKP